MGGHRIKVWRNANRTGQINLSQRGNVVPGTLYVEGITNSATVRDVELRLEYDENPQGQSNPLFKCEDRVRQTVISVVMTAYRPQTETAGYGNPFQRIAVPADEKESPGVGIRFNGDDDNNNGTPGRNDMTVNNENDLIEVLLNAALPATSGGFTYVLESGEFSSSSWFVRTHFPLSADRLIATVP